MTTSPRTYTTLRGTIQFVGNWIEVDPSDAFARRHSEGPLIRRCPNEDHTHGQHIKACFGYVNIDLFSFVGQPLQYGHSAPTVLGREVYRNLKLSNGTLGFVLEMLEDQSKQNTLRIQAEQLVSNLPAAQVSSGSEERRVRSEYERLRCSQ